VGGVTPDVFRLHVVSDKDDGKSGKPNLVVEREGFRESHETGVFESPERSERDRRRKHCPMERTIYSEESSIQN
jgi:hypothetical protein